MAYSCIAALPEPGEGASGTRSPCTAALELSLRNLPPRQPSNPSRQLAGQPATLGILDRHQTVLGSWQACLFSSPVPGLPLLFLWASESNVRHFGPPAPLAYSCITACATKPFSAAGRPASSLRLFQACLFCSYGLPKATLGILARLQTLPSAFGLLLRRSLAEPFQALPKACVQVHCGWPTPASQPCLRQAGAWGGSRSPCTAALELSLRNLPPRQPSNPSRQLAGQPATLGILDRHQTVLGSWQACLFSSPVPGLPLLFLWASESNVRHFGPPSNPSQRLWPTPASQPCLTLLGSWQASQQR